MNRKHGGAEPWDGSTTLHEMMDFSDMSKCLRGKKLNCGNNAIEIRREENTEMFKTNVRQVFDFN